MASKNLFGWRGLAAASLFVLSVLSGCGGSDSSSAPTIGSFIATPATTAEGGGSVTLSWDASGATSLAIDQGVGDVTGTTSKVVNVTASQTFTLTATNSDGATTKQVTVTVPPTSIPVEVPTGRSPIILTAATPAATFAALAPKVKVGTVSIASEPVVHFSMTDADGNAIIGFGSKSKNGTATLASYPNLSFTLAKLVPGTNGSPSKWVSYIVTTVPTTTAAAAPTRPNGDNHGTLVDHDNGTYTYTFYRDITKVKEQVAAMTVTNGSNKDDLGDLSYEPNLTHRLAIQVSGNAPGTGTNTPDGKQVTPGVPMVNPVDVIHDFIPATGKPVTASDFTRDIAANAKCEECHRKLGGIPGSSSTESSALFHGGSRNEVRYCVVCHTEQRKFGQTEAGIDTTTNTFTSGTRVVDGRAIGNLPNFIHKTHLGAMLAKKNYDYAGVAFNTIHYPQDVRNCTKCHDGGDTSTAKTAQGDNWKTAPSALACGSCHDGINFKTGKGVTLADAALGKTTSTYGHVAGAKPDDSQCAICHTPENIDVNHLPVTPPNAGNSLLAGGTNSNTNAAWIASNTSRLPEGAIKVSYDIKRVYRDATTKQPVMVFRMLQNGVPKNLNKYEDTAESPATGRREIWDNFMGAPSVYFVFATPQDGIAQPADFNRNASAYLRCLWNGTVPAPDPDSCTVGGKLTGPDTDGYYTATLTAAIPDNAVMLTGGLGYSYNVKTQMPLTQTNLADYPTAPATGSGLTAGMPNATGGLIVITPNAQMVAEGYTGRRAIVEDKRCNACHQELGTFTEDAFHAGQRNDGTTCSWCHTPNRASGGWSADSTSFVHAIHAAAKRTEKYTWHAISPTEDFSQIHYPGVLSQCETCHLPNTYDFSAAGSASAAPNRQYRTVVSGTLSTTNGTYVYPVYTDGNGVPYVTAGVNYGSGFNATTGADAAATTLVTSPTATVCVACHDSSTARAHMVNEGGSLYSPRSAALPKAEQCLLCHGPDKVANIKTMHSK